jgi:hypothetical protein
MDSPASEQADHDAGKPASMLEAERLWNQGDGFAAGKLVLAGFSDRQSAALAFAILRIARKFTRKMLLPLWNLLWIKNCRCLWWSAHSIFYEIRTHTLRLEKRREKGLLSENDLIHYHYLLLAENIARTVYNASEPDDPFDEDSPIAMIACFSDFVEKQGSVQLKEDAAGLLFDESRKRPA